MSAMFWRSAVAAILLLVASFGSGSAAAAEPRLAIKGYDPVAYFTESRPTQGKPDLSFDWQGARYHFASAANRDLFAANPGRYAPQYSGYCAFGIANKVKAEVDPTQWSIADGKLYLNYDSSVTEMMRKDFAGTVKQADENWARMQN
jgi:hypothetical protein